MSSRYNQNPIMTGATRFTKAPMASVEYSRMVANPVWALPFNAGDIVPVYYSEVLPHDTFSLDLNFVIRQMTAQYPTMGQMQVDFFAYFVPNRIINESWKNVQGENTSGFWSAPEVALSPLVSSSAAGTKVQIPVGSIADYYGFPTQAPIPAEVLMACNDLKFRGYLEIYNNYFRDENYQPPIPYSKLNVYNGFLQEDGSEVGLMEFNLVPSDTPADGSYGAGAVAKAVYGAGGKNIAPFSVSSRLSSWSALGKPLKANKLHDFITSGLPSPQKGSEVYFGIGDVAPVDISFTDEPIDYRKGDHNKHLKLLFDGQKTKVSFYNLLARFTDNSSSPSTNQADVGIPNAPNTDDKGGNFYNVNGLNIQAVTDLSQATGISVNDLRTAIATQQVYETLARGGSRYVEMLRSFFEIETENPFLDIPTELGHIRRDLDLYQVAQTSASGATGTDTPQGELSAFGYTTNGGNLFTRTFLEHGYVHVFAVVRQRNMYSTYFAPDNFRLNTMDFYLPQFANIGEQPIRLATLNPFADGALDKVIAYQEAWWDYRYEPDRVHGVFRSGVDGSLDVWHYGDSYDKNFEVVTGDWLKSNAEEVLNRTITTTSDLVPQFKGLFSWRVDKQRPMPTYSVPGLDIV